MNVVCMGLEMLSFVALSLGVYTGMRTLHRNRELFSHFGLTDVASLRIDAVLYVLVTFSTMLCVTDVMINAGWLSQSGYVDQRMPAIWRIMYLMFGHIGGALVATGVHVLVDKLLDNQDFCALCKRSHDDAGSR